MTEIYWCITSSRDIRTGDVLRRMAPGLLAYHKLLDSLKSPVVGTAICKVAIGGTIEIAAEGRCLWATELTVLDRTTVENGERVLREFAQWCALSVGLKTDLEEEEIVPYLETAPDSLPTVGKREMSELAKEMCAEAWAMVSHTKNVREAAFYAARGNVSHNHIPSASRERAWELLDLRLIRWAERRFVHD